MDQPSLFPDLATPTSPRRRTSQRRFLSETRERFELLQQCPTLLRIARKAAKSTVRAEAATSGRSASESFEKVLVGEILEQASAIEAELLELADAAGRVEILGVEFETGTGLADLLVIWRLTGRSPLPVAVNVKKLTGSSQRRTEGCSLTQFLALATDPEFDVRQPRSSRSIPTWCWVLEWCAGRRQIQPRTDYYLLIGEVEDGRLLRLRFQGTLSTVRTDGRAVIAKHANKETVNLIVSDVKALPDDVDPNSLIAGELLPRPDLDALRSMLAAVLCHGCDSDVVAQVAVTLLDVDDETLLAWVRRGLADLGSDPALPDFTVIAVASRDDGE